jgi:aminoglycoside/choline kinase family phosphotransferase
MFSSQKEISNIFEKYFGQKPEIVSALPASGSNRQYFRIISNDKSAIATLNSDRTENEAFLYITGKLNKAGVNVPEIYAADLDSNVYLQEDLGDIDLFKLVSDEKHLSNGKIVELYKKVIDEMPAIQYKSTSDFDFSICYPRHAFDRQSMHWDLSYFKYHFLKLAYTSFHEQKLEDDFNRLIDFLLEAPSEFFLYRDFQSRNIMMHKSKVYFIDYQGGRKGAMQYDLASLLFEAKTGLTSDVREELLGYFSQVYGSFKFFDRNLFLKYFPGFALIRLLQAFGAYGYRGYFERKPYFLQSIPPAIATLKWMLSNYDLGIKLPHLTETLTRMVEQLAFNLPELIPGKLTITINSFSYRRGIPEDFTGNGGGFVFDCRSLPNPGRLDEYKTKTGKDTEVIKFLQGKHEVESFIDQVMQIISTSINEYQQRQFEHIMISFGCTGGQHRSVYCAEQLAKKLNSRSNVHINVKHQELERNINVNL